MKKVAVLLEGGHVTKEFREIKKIFPGSKDIVDIAHLCYNEDKEDLFRIYYYDGMPFQGKIPNPVTGGQKEYKKSDVYEKLTTFHDEIAISNTFAYRAGHLKFRGYKVDGSALKKYFQQKIPIEASSIKPTFQQKGVDIKIGLDISWLATRRIVDRIILFTGDTDFIPAMKFARREGVQIVLVAFEDHKEKVNIEMKKHSDEFRTIKI